MPLKSAETKAANAAALRAKLRGEPLAPQETSESVPPATISTTWDAQRALRKFSNVVRSWNRRHPDQPIASVKFEGGMFSFQCKAPGAVSQNAH